MNFELPYIVKDEINLILSKKYIYANIVSENFEEDYLNILNEIKLFSNKFNKFLILVKHEVITDEWFFDELIKIIHESKKDIKICQATASNDILYGTHPFTHIFLWKLEGIRKSDREVDYNDFTTQIFPEFLYNKFDDYVNIKNEKTILSVRNNSYFRDEIIKKINTKSISIFRYLNINSDNNLNKSIPWYDLIEEYKKSYVSIVLETNYGKNISNYLTEKTILSFLTGCIPIVYGQKNLIKDLENLGFWIANKDFGFENGDDYSNQSNYKIELYSKCVNNISSMDINYIKNYYQENINKIYRNWEIIYTIFNYSNKNII